MDNFRIVDSEFLPVLVKQIPFIFTLLGSFIGYLLYSFVWSRYRYFILSGSVNDFKINYLIRNFYREFYCFFNNK